MFFAEPLPYRSYSARSRLSMFYFLGYSDFVLIIFV